MVRGVVSEGVEALQARMPRVAIVPSPARMQLLGRECACGGGCEECRKKKQPSATYSGASGLAVPGVLKTGHFPSTWAAFGYIAISQR